MQTIYIDTLLCVNLFIDYVIICTIKMILHINAKGYRLLLAALFGAFTALLVTVPIKSIFISAIIKITTTIGVVLIAYGKGSLRKFTIRLLMYLGISMILSSFVVMLNLLWKPTGVFIYNNELYFDVSPTVLIISTAIIYLAVNLYQRITATQNLKCRIYKVTFTTSKNHYSIETALDTGCNLIEPFSGMPVILTEKELLQDLDIPKEKLRIIPYHTAAGSDIVYGFKPKTIDIDGKILNTGCYIGICNNKINGEVRSIMGPRITEAL